MKKFVLLCLFNIFLIPFLAYSQCENDILDIGNDTTICFGDSLILSIPNNFMSHVWSNGSDSDQLIVSDPGFYFLDAESLGNNLILNPSFELGDTNFISDYTYGSFGPVGILSYESTYAITNSPQNVHYAFEDCSDHTLGNDSMLVANGADTANVMVWCQSIIVQPNTNYKFSFWQTNVLNSSEVSDLQLFINNMPITGIMSTSQIACEWQQNVGTWNSGNNNLAVIKIVNQSTVASGNDFAIDDLFFGEYCTFSDTIQVEVENVQVNLGPDLIKCSDVVSTITVQNPINGYSYNWFNDTIFLNSGESLNICQIDSLKEYCVRLFGKCSNNDIYDCINIGIENKIFPSLLADTNQGCSQQSINFYPSPNSNNIIISKIEFGDGNWLGFPWVNNTIVPYIYTNPGLYDVRYSVTSINNCIYDTEYVSMIHIHSNPKADFGFDVSSLDLYSPHTTVQDLCTEDVVSWKYEIPNGIPAHTEDSTFNVNFIEGVPGYYLITLIVQNEFNCLDTVSKYIHVPNEIVVYAPNSFTPNNDQMNDVWKVECSGIDMEDFELQIFNRWGNVVWETNDPYAGWTGEMKEVGIYTWVLTCSNMENGEKIRIDGHLNLLR